MKAIRPSSRNLSYCNTIILKVKLYTKGLEFKFTLELYQIDYDFIFFNAVQIFLFEKKFHHIYKFNIMLDD